MKPRRTLLTFGLTALSGLLWLGACGDTSSSEPAGLEPRVSEDPHAEPDEDFAPPDDDPSTGSEDLEDEEPAPLPEPVDAGADATPDDPQLTPLGNDCVVGGTYCGNGGDPGRGKVTGEVDTLYRCQGPGTPEVVRVCAHGCRVTPGQNDACAPDPNACVPSPVPGHQVTYAYGVRNARYAAGYHTGEDYAAPTGRNVVAVRSGTIRWSNNSGGAYGRWIGLDADNGRTYVYCHLSTRAVAAGAQVTAGQVIGKVGATGNVTGPHLHFEDHPQGPFRYNRPGIRKPKWCDD